MSWGIVSYRLQKSHQEYEIRAGIDKNKGIGSREKDDVEWEISFFVKTNYIVQGRSNQTVW